MSTTATIPQQAARLAEQALIRADAYMSASSFRGAEKLCAMEREKLHAEMAALVTLITAESLRLDWLLARHTERGSKLIGLGFYPDKQEQRRMIQMAIDAGTCVVDEVDAIEVRKVRLDEARDAALWRAHVAGAASPQAPAPQAAEAGQVEAEPVRTPNPDDLLTVAHIEPEGGGATLILGGDQLGDFLDLVGDDEETYTVRIAGMKRAEFEALGEFDGF